MRAVRGAGVTGVWFLKAKRIGGTYKAAVPAEAEHHPAIGSHGEETAMPDTDYNNSEEDDSAIFSKDIYEYLQHGLPVGGVERVVKVLNGEEEGEEHEETEEGREAYGANHSDWGAPGCFSCLFGKMCGGVKAC